PGHRRAHAPDLAAADPGTADRTARRHRRRDHPERDRVRGARARREPSRGKPRDCRHPLLHLRVHALAEAHDGPEHRHRRGRGAWARRGVRRLRSAARPVIRGPAAGRRAERVPVLAPLPRAVVRRHHGGRDRTALIDVALAVLAAAIYLRGARMRPSWPLWRTLLFCSGLAAVLASLASPIDTIALDLFSVHMVQHMLLMVAAAPLLLLGAPVRPL